MSYDGSGQFNLPAGFDLSNGTTADGPEVAGAFTEIATGLSTAITKDGQTTVTANLPMATYRHTNVGNPTARTQYATAAGVQDGTYVYLTSVSGTDTITATAALSMSAYATGQAFVFLPAATNTGATTININSIGAKNVYFKGAACAGGELIANVPALIVYDGTQFNIVANGHAIHAGIVNAKGDLIAGTAADAVARVAVGTNNQVLIANSGATAGVSWAAAESVVAAASDTAAGKLEIAVQSEMETPTSALLAVTPARMQYHPGVIKVWAVFGVAGDVVASHNVSSVTDTGTGRATVVFDTDFSNGYYCVTTGLILASGTNYAAYQLQGTNNVGSVEINCVNSSTAALVDPTHNYAVQITGDQ